MLHMLEAFLGFVQTERVFDSVFRFNNAGGFSQTTSGWLPEVPCPTAFVFRTHSPSESRRLCRSESFSVFFSKLSLDPTLPPPPQPPPRSRSCSWRRSVFILQPPGPNKYENIPRFSKIVTMKFHIFQWFKFSTFRAISKETPRVSLWSYFIFFRAVAIFRLTNNVSMILVHGNFPPPHPPAR